MESTVHIGATGAALFVVAMLLSPERLAAQASHEDVNAANNPLQPSVSLDLQNQYAGQLYDLPNTESNSLLLRGATPHKLFGKPQLLRATLPVMTTPDVPPGGRHTDLGDLNLFDIFLAKRGALELGVGPQLTAPTAGRDETGTGKWQAGLAALVVSPRKWGLAGALLTWQHSFAGDSDRRTQNNVLFQPLLIYNLPSGAYIRSTASWIWDIEADTYAIPIGLGAGYVWKAGMTTLNVFAEPQWTVLHDGSGMPQFQVYAGLNLQFPLKK